MVAVGNVSLVVACGCVDQVLRVACARVRAYVYVRVRACTACVRGVFWGCDHVDWGCPVPLLGLLGGRSTLQLASAAAREPPEGAKRARSRLMGLLLEV